MKKIMFNDRYGLTQAVLEGKKTMTRRIIPDIEIDWARRGRVTLPVGGFEHDVLFMNVRSMLPGWRASRGAQIENYVSIHFWMYGMLVPSMTHAEVYRDWNAKRVELWQFNRSQVQKGGM